MGFFKSKNLLFLLVILLSLSIMITGCKRKEKETTIGEKNIPDDGSLEKDEEIDDVQVFRFRHNSPVVGLDPILNTTAPDNGVHNMTLETFITFVADEEGNLITKPAAAESWDISDDGLVYTFYIRENAVWNDGVPVTADDFVYTFRQMATPEVASTIAWLYDGVIVNFSESLYDEGKKPEDIGVRAIDDKTVEFTLVKPYSYFLDLLEGAKPIRQDKYEEWGEEYGSTPEKTVTNGPFKIESWDQNVQMTLVKNEKYWDAENIILDRIERKIIKETPTAVQAFLSGEIDVVGAAEPEWREEIEKEGDRFRKIETDGRAPEFLGFNVSNKYFKNPKIRLAFSLAIDREKYIEDLEHGLAEPLYSMMPAITNVGDELYTTIVSGKNQIIKRLKDEHPDPKALLIEGLKEEGLDPDPSKMEIRLATRGTTEYSKKSSEWFLQQWKEKLGVTITIDMMEWNIMWDKVDEGDYDICTSGWGPYYNDPNALLELYDPENGYFDSSKSGWTGPDADKYHELLKEASNIADYQKRAEILLEAEEILVGTAIIAPTYCRKSVAYLANYVQNYYVNPHASTDYTKIYTKGRP